MAKTVKIPDNMRPNWECEINCMKYSYPAGVEMEVPDEVAAIIEANEELEPKPGGGSGHAPNSVWLEGETVKTNCDIWIEAVETENEDTGDFANEYRLVQGDYTTAKAKILKGLPVFVYCNYTNVYSGDGGTRTIIESNIYPTYYVEDHGEEYIALNASSLLRLRQDGTVEKNW